MSVIDWAERGLLPDWLVRTGIRRLLRQRLGELPPDATTAEDEFVAAIRREPLAVATDAANSQHYEVPAEFFRLVLGPRLKYSCCLFDSPRRSLAEAEEAMLALTCERAELHDGQDVLELGCGWGSLSLWIAEHYPQSRITAVSNSHGQRKFIEQRARRAGLHNLQVVTADMRDFTTDSRFDRIVSVEMFEHMRNYELLLERVSQWLRPDGCLMVHIFCHRTTPYLFETEGESNWMGRHFFTGGMMPSESLLRRFDQHLAVEDQWRVNGKHYADTCEQWLWNLDMQRDAVEQSLRSAVGDTGAAVAVQRWRMFFMACAELFRYGGGEEWFVTHARMRPAARLQPAAS